MSAYLQKFVRQKEDIDAIIEILKYNKIFNEHTMEFNSDLIKPSLNFEAGISFKNPLPEPPISNPQIVSGVVINKPKPQEVRAFQLQELKKNSGDEGRNIEEIDFGPFRYHREKIIELVRHLSSTKATHYQEEKDALAKELAGSVSNRTMGIIRHSIISPLTAPVISIGVDKMAQAFMDLQEHKRLKRMYSFREKLISSPPEIILEELRERAESLSDLVPVSTGLSAGDEPLIDVDTFSTLAYTAEKIIVWAKDYAEFAEKYPNLAENLLPAISISTKAIIGGVVGSAGGPIGSALGATTGLLAGVGSEIQGMLINEVAGEKISETISYAIDKATDLWKSLDPSLTEDQARALGAAGVIGVMTGAQGKIAAKEALHFAANLKSPKTSHGLLNFFRKKDQSRKIQEGSVGTRVTTHAPKSTKLVVDGKPAFYADAPYHHPHSTGMIKSKAPARGAEMLEHSVPLNSKTIPRRIAVDKINILSLKKKLHL